MKKLKHSSSQHHHTEQQQQRQGKCIFPVIIIASLLSLLTLLFFALTLTSPDAARIFPFPFPISATTPPPSPFVESKLHPLPAPPPSSLPPRLAYLISASPGDSSALLRTLSALYHPRNLYLLHLDLASSPHELNLLTRHVRSHLTFRRFLNVLVLTNRNLVTYRGPTMVATTLHAAAIALTQFHSHQWDWFINLSASDYPLLTQDDLLHVFSRFPRHLNFIDHTSDIGWKDAR